MAKRSLQTVLHQIFEDVINEGDVALVDALFAEEFVDHDPRALPGREGFKQGLLAVRTAFPDWTVTLERVVVQGNEVAGRWMGRGTNLGPFLGMPPTGRRIEMREMGMFRFAGGRLAEAWRVADELSMLQQLGIVPPLGSPFVPRS